VGEEAQKLFDNAQAMLKRIIDEKLIEARGVIAFYECNQVDHEDIEVYAGEGQEEVQGKFHTLRQQLDQDNDIYFSMADFITPKSVGKRDYIGMFAVSAGFKQEELCRQFEADHDDYNVMLVKTLTDRLAEAFAERMHAEVRKTHWGYSPEEELSNSDLLSVKYQGIRPAPGYPSQPDHTEKNTLWKLAKVEENTGIKLTESLAMWPASSVSGLYFGNKCAQYFSVNEITKEQVTDYAGRKGVSEEEIEKWLSPILSYNPDS
jgi:5-methyltetrahydrofolate--homocysteine methyltransferase